MIERNKTYLGNSPDILNTFPDKYFNTCITSPPYYGLRSYGTEPQIWGGKKDCKHKWNKEIIATNSGAGWNDADKRKRYQNQRLKNPAKERERKVSQGKFCSKCHAWKGELGLEPTFQLYLHHLKIIFTEIKRVLRDDGTLFVNIGDSSGKKISLSKSMLQIPHRFSIMMTDELGFILRRNIIWHKPSIMPMSYKDNYTLDYEDIFFFTKNQKYYFEQQFEPADYDGRKDTKFKGSIKYDNARISPDGNVNTFAKLGHERWMVDENGIKLRNKRSVWCIPAEPLKEEHFATFPQKLVYELIKAACPAEVCTKCGLPVQINYKGEGPGIGKSMNDHKDDMIKGNRIQNPDAKSMKGYFRVKTITKCKCNKPFQPGVVLDPFIGSGTTGVVARKLNRDYVGIDLKYDEIREDRLHNELGLFK